MPWDLEALSAKQRVQYVTALASVGYRIRARSVTMPASFSAGSRIRVRTAWSNQGTAPTYDDWDVRLTFVGVRSGASVVTSLGRPLTGLVGSARSTRTVRPSGLDRGRYRVFLSAVDPSGYSAPMRLANRGRTAGGTYPVGTITVR